MGLARLGERTIGQHRRLSCTPLPRWFDPADCGKQTGLIVFFSATTSSRARQGLTARHGELYTRRVWELRITNAPILRAALIGEQEQWLLVSA